MININIVPTRHYGNDLTVAQFVHEFQRVDKLGKKEAVAFYFPPLAVFNQIVRQLGLDPEITRHPSLLYKSNVRVLEDTRRPNNNLAGKISTRAVTWMRNKQDLPIITTHYSYHEDDMQRELLPALFLLGSQALAEFTKEFSDNI